MVHLPAPYTVQFAQLGINYSSRLLDICKETTNFGADYYNWDIIIWNEIRRNKESFR